ncbi:MAG: hypothetical protein V1885_00195 [Candidatus Brennerbacteria bacterium]
MSIFSHRGGVPIADRWKIPLAWAVLTLLLFASFAVGYFLGQENSIPPIIIETRG